MPASVSAGLFLFNNMPFIDPEHWVVAKVLEGKVEAGAGDEGLYFLFDDDFHDGALAVEVELAHDVVQKDNS